MITKAIREKIAAFIHRHPEMTYRMIADHLKISHENVRRIASEFGVRRYQQQKVTDDLLAKLEQ